MHVVLADGQDGQGKGYRHHRAANHDIDRAVFLDAVASDDGVGHQRVGAVHAAHEHAGRPLEAQQAGGEQADGKRAEKRQYAVQKCVVAVLLKLVEVNLHACLEHDVEHAHIAQHLDGRILAYPS